MFKGEDNKGKGPFHHVISRVYANNINITSLLMLIMILAEVSIFPIVTFLCLSPFHTVLFGRKSPGAVNT